MAVELESIPGLELIPGKWYISYPSTRTPGQPPVAGPFDAQDEARHFLQCAILPRGGVVWKCQYGNCPPSDL
jgi:hypothetical protein